MAPKSINVSNFANAQLSLLAAEALAETQSTSLLLSTSSPRTLERAGLALTNLIAVSQRTGFGGKTIVEFQLDAAVDSGKSKGRGDVQSGLIENGGLRVGDVVGIKELGKGEKRKIAGKANGKSQDDDSGNEAKELKGVISKVGQRSINVALDSEEDGSSISGGRRVWLVKLSNEVTYKRMNQTITKLSKLSEEAYSPLIRVLFGSLNPTLPQESAYSELSFVNPGLNPSQQTAVKFALASPELALIHGPPGTGKTSTIIELVLQLLKRKPQPRMLICGPSNLSVDNIVERLSPHKVPVIRLGHPARLLQSVVEKSLDVLTKTSEGGQLMEDIRKEIDECRLKISKSRSGAERRGIYAEMRELRKELRERERKTGRDVMTSVKVVCATLHGAGGRQIEELSREGGFDVCIIDEASQALEAQCWVPLLTGKGIEKLVLAGDHLQLGPVVKSDDKKVKRRNDEKGNVKETRTPRSLLVEGKGDPGKTNRPNEDDITLADTLFHRLLRTHGSGIKRMLTVQYRMHDAINRFPSAELYDSKLVADDSVRDRLLKDILYSDGTQVQDTEDTRAPLVFIDTQGGNFPEKLPEEEPKKGKKGLGLDSRSNENEALLVCSHVKSLASSGVKASDIAVITPYNAQLSLLHTLLDPFKRSGNDGADGVEIGTIDSFQGREKEAVIVSLVRSNDAKEVGFLAEKRRLNVAMTRARRYLCVVGDSETVGAGSGYLKRWMQFLEENADLRYPDVADLADAGAFEVGD